MSVPNLPAAAPTPAAPTPAAPDLAETRPSRRAALGRAAIAFLVSLLTIAAIHLAMGA